MVDYQVSENTSEQPYMLTYIAHEQIGIGVLNAVRDYYSRVANSPAPEVVNWHVNPEFNSELHFTFANGVTMKAMVIMDIGPAFEPTWLEQAILEVREKIANRLHVDISEVSVANILPDPVVPSITCVAGELEIEYRVTQNDEAPYEINLHLVQVNHAITGLQLLQQVKDKLAEVTNAPVPDIVSWQTHPGFDGELHFTFANGITMKCLIMEGMPAFEPEWGEEAILHIRTEIAQRMDLPLSEVSLSSTHLFGLPSMVVTCVANNLEFSYRVRHDYSEPFELTAVRNVDLDIHLLGLARDKLREVANIPSIPKLVFWGVGDEGSIEFHFANGFCMVVDIETGESSFYYEYLEEAIVEARERIADVMNVDASDVTIHNGWERPFWTYLYTQVGNYKITYQVSNHPDIAPYQLTSLVNTSTSSADLAVNARSMVYASADVEGGTAIVHFGIGDDTAWFDISYTDSVGQKHNAIVKCDAATGVATDIFILGDLNGDGKVGSGDLDILRSNWGAEGVDYFDGDLDHDGSVTSSDLDMLRAFWGDEANWITSTQQGIDPLLDSQLNAQNEQDDERAGAVPPKPIETGIK